MEKKLVVELNNLIAGRKYWDGLKQEKEENLKFFYNRGLVALYELLEKHPEITEEEFKNLLRSKPVEFAYARKILKFMPDLYSELKEHGPFSASFAYKYSLRMKQLEKKSDRIIRYERSFIGRMRNKRLLKAAERYRKEHNNQASNYEDMNDNDNLNIN